MSNWTTFSPTYSTWTDIPGGGINQLTPGVNSFLLTGAVRTLASGTSYTIVLAVSGLRTSQDYEAYGICVTDGTKYLTLMNGVHPGGAGTCISIDGWATTTSASTNYYDNYAVESSGTIWYKMVNDGTHRTFYISADGLYWLQIYQSAYNGYLSETAAGFCAFADGNSGANTTGISMNVLHWAGA
jgi:hypothetical protein